MKFVFGNLKNRSYKIDMFPDSHKIDVSIENTEEAFNFFDEILVYKTAAVFDYLHNLNQKKFNELIKGIFSNKEKSLFDRKIFYENLYSIKFKNKQKEDFLEIKLAKVFQILTENRGIIKIETVKMINLSSIIHHFFIFSII